MKKLFACAVALIFAQTAFAGPKREAGDIKWADETVTESVSYSSGRVYGVGGDGSGTGILVRAYKANKGRVLWEQRFIASDFFQAQEIFATEELVAVVGFRDDGNGVDWFIAAMDAEDGELEWQKTIEAPGFGITNSVTVVGETVVVVGSELISEDFVLPAKFVTRAFDADDGHLKWEDINPNLGISFGEKVVGVMRRDDEDDDDDEDDEDYDDDGGIVIAYGQINNNANLTDKLIRAYDVESGHILWTTVVDSGGLELVGPHFVVEDGMGYFSFGSLDFSDFSSSWQVQSLDVRDGSVAWMSPQGGLLTNVSGIAIDRGELIAVTDCITVGIDPSTGDGLWDVPLNAVDCLIVPAVAKGRAILAAANPDAVAELTVTALDATDGSPEWSVAVPGALPQPFVNSSLYNDSITSGKGLVFVGGTQLTAFKIR